MPSKYTQIWSFEDLAQAVQEMEQEYALRIKVSFGIHGTTKTLEYRIHVWDVEGNTDMGEQHRSLVRNGKDASRVISAATLAIHALEGYWRANPWLAPAKLRRLLREAPSTSSGLPSAPLPKF